MVLSKALVIGAGELGLPVIQNLVENEAVKKKEAEVAVMLRPSTLAASNPSPSLQTLQLLPVSIIGGDISQLDVSSLADIFRPYDVLICCTGYSAGVGNQVKITKAALEAGVKRFFPWQFGVDYDAVGKGSAQDLWDEQLNVRQLLRSQSTTDWIIVSTGLFLQYLFWEAFGIVEIPTSQQSPVVVRALGSWENEVTVTTVEDVGRVTARIALDEPSIKNQVVYIAGDTISYGQLAEIVERTLGRTVSRERWTVDFLKAQLRKEPQDEVKKYRVAFAESKGVAWATEKTYNAQKGLKTIGVEQWLVHNKCAGGD